MAIRGIAFDAGAGILIAGLAFGSAALMQGKILPFKKKAPPSAAYMPGRKMLKIASFGFDKAVADVIWVQSIQYLHGEIIAEGNEGRKAPLYYSMADVVTDLDPDFRDAYYASSIFLAMMGRLPEAERILAKAIGRKPGTYFHHFALGSLLYLEPRRSESEEEYDLRKTRGMERLKAAFEAPDCPAFEAEFIRRVLARTSFREAAFELLRRKFAAESDRHLREHWLLKLRQTVAEEWLDAIRTSLRSFREKNGSFPAGLEQLTAEPGRARVFVRRQGRLERFTAYATAPAGLQPVEDWSDVVLYDSSSGEAFSMFLDGIMVRAKAETVEGAQRDFTLRFGRRAVSLDELVRAGLIGRALLKPVFGRFALDSEGKLVLEAAGGPAKD